MSAINLDAFDSLFDFLVNGTATWPIYEAVIGRFRNGEDWLQAFPLLMDFTQTTVLPITSPLLSSFDIFVFYGLSQKHFPKKNQTLETMAKNGYK